MESVRLGFAERIRGAADARTPLRLRAGGTKDFYGCAPRGEVLDVRGYAGIVSYEPTELVLTARAGTPLAELEGALARERQMLPFEPPHLGDGATLGGCVASGLSGPRRAAAGAVRDFVLGARILDGRGRDLSFGGQVMKNVAGYDVSRLLAGSLGTLGLILEVSLKVLPQAPEETTLLLEVPEDKALEQCNRWAGSPLPISATAWWDGELAVRLSGAPSAVRAAAGKLGGARMDGAEAAAYWLAVREQRSAFFAAEAGGEAPLWRLSVPSNAPVIALTGDRMFEWGGAQRWVRSHAPADAVRAAAQAAGGHATRYRGGDRSAGVFAPLPPALTRLHRELKAAFDPQQILNPGRMYPEF